MQFQRARLSKRYEGGIMLIVLSGVSGSGKNTVIEEILKERKDFKVFRSAITRPPRENEDRKGFYIFISEQEFLKKVEEGAFFEYEFLHNSYRGILKAELEKAKMDEKHHYIRDIDVKGNQKLRKFFHNKGVLSIFLEVDDKELQRRLKARGESDQQIKLRLSRAPMERTYKKDYDLIIQNNDLALTVEKILEFVDKHS